MRVKALLGLAMALAWPAWAMATRADVYAIVDARVVTISGATFERATVVLRDGVIEAVGPNVKVPVDARVLSGQGLTITPGLIDGFSGIGLPAPRSGASPGPSPAPLTPQSFVLDRLRPSDTVKSRDAGVTTALVVPREGVLPGRSVIVNLGDTRRDAMVVRQPAALHLHLVTVSGGQYPGSLMGTVAYARQALLDAAHYRDEWAAYERTPRGRKRPRYDAALAAWQDVVAGRIPLVVTASRENDVRRILALGDELKVRVVAAGAPQAFRVADLVKARKLPLLVSVNFDPASAAPLGGEDEEKLKREVEEAERNPAALHKAGVPFALVSGHATNFLAGVRKAVDRGLPRDAALRAVTLEAARVLGLDDRMGSLEVGKMANLVAWTGEPLAKDTKARMVFVDGVLFEPEDRPEKKEDGPSASPSPSPAPTVEVRR
jgi:imidazolonepropionase-like amidohydrolase